MLWFTSKSFELGANFGCSNTSNLCSNSDKIRTQIRWYVTPKLWSNNLPSLVGPYFRHPWRTSGSTKVWHNSLSYSKLWNFGGDGTTIMIVTTVFLLYLFFHKRYTASLLLKFGEPHHTIVTMRRCTKELAGPKISSKSSLFLSTCIVTLNFHKY